jgi:hypothetical protein
MDHQQPTAAAAAAAVACLLPLALVVLVVVVTVAPGLAPMEAMARLILAEGAVVQVPLVPQITAAVTVVPAS